ncbi:hypothetical protein DPMN_122599 [Dreissena polymorpha]|uniref:Uncharacterized protein n=1 Tax=Dreissena polymorpha TaxID=45954 RepID=A0A9D4JU83_DREPO|nr:hypothetical protein DPMN_122477 [Dreissena polymorpha]KAH3820850.1 hypothetical protein DPMN_122599 [Dreissena polymorpha]
MRGNNCTIGGTMPKDLGRDEMAKGVDPVTLVIPLPKKDNLKLCENNRTISLISLPSSHALHHPLSIEK